MKLACTLSGQVRQDTLKSGTLDQTHHRGTTLARNGYPPTVANTMMFDGQRPVADVSPALDNNPGQPA